MPPLNILIIGASIAGPTTAYFLAKSHPTTTITVVERYPNLRSGGQNIDIRTCGVTVMRRIPGMEDAVRAKMTQLEGISFVREDGSTVGTIRPTGNPEQQSLVSEYEIYRGTLSEIVYDFTKDHPRIKYVFGETVVSMQQQNDDSDSNEGDPIIVDFANGHPRTTYDLVVACDGATSRTRAMGLGCGLREYVHPINSWAAYFTINQELLGGSKVGQAYSAPGGRFIAGGMDPSQPGVNRIVLMGISPMGERDATLGFRKAMKAGDDELKRFIAKHYTGAGWKTDAIMAAMLESSPDFYANEIVQVKPPILSKGRFVLVGDAGYAPGPTGSGTTLALTGAYVLAGEICKHSGNVAAGLAGYEAVMRPIITDLQKIPAGVPGIFAPQTAWGIWVRNAIFAVISWTRVMEFAQRLLGVAFAGGDKYGFPEYEWAA